MPATPTVFTTPASYTVQKKSEKPCAVFTPERH